MKLKSDTVLITGGSSGIGLEMARQLTALGNTVIITGRDLKKLERVQKELPGIYFYQSDLSDPQSIAKLAVRISADFPNMNVLINNAGIMRTVDFNNTEDSMLCSEIEVNLKGPIHMVQQFLPLLKKQPEAAIINVTSGLAFLPFPETPVYCASKAALHVYTKILRVQLEDTRVQVFELAPPKTTAALIDRVGTDGSKNKMPTMEVSKVVRTGIKSIIRGKKEILPGLSKVLKLAGRIQL